MPANPSIPFFRAAACLFAIAALFHLSRVFLPQEGDPSGTLRHGVFVAINLTCVAGLLLRPRVFKFAFIPLALQQAFSHGSAAWNAWAEHGELDLVSLVILVLMPATAAMLWTADRRSDPTVHGSS